MRQWLLLLLKGALIGVGGILPGISGGVLCVTLGVYQPLMALLAHPIRELKARMGFFIPLVIGVALGVLGLSRLVNWLFVTSPVPAVWLFIGLIAGTVPSLWREAGERGRGVGALLTGGLTFLVALAALLLWSRASIRLSPNPWVWLLCGALWGLGVILPGLSPSSLFVFLGVYQPMTAGVADLSLPVLLPMALGLLICVLTLSKAMNRLLERCYAKTMHAIMGLSLAATAAIIPFSSLADFPNCLIYALCLAAGVLASFGIDRIGAKQAAGKIGEDGEGKKGKGDRGEQNGNLCSGKREGEKGKLS